jgi:alcohol dehydrogenase
MVSVGGGSVHDCAKVIALVATNGGSVADFEGFDRSRHPSLPLMAVNTTAGSGAEMSRFAVITDPARGAKMILADRHLVPLVAIEDPELTVSMPPAVTAASGLDALTHAVEAHVSSAASDFTRLMSRRAVEVIANALPTAYRKGSDLDARWSVLYGSVLAAHAFNSASVGAVHALAHQLGGKLGLVHGVCNAVLLPVVSAYNAETCPDLYADLAPALGVGGRGRTAARGVVERLRGLIADVGIPPRLRDLGVDDGDIPVLARMAMTDMCIRTNPRPLNEDEVVELFRRAW